MSFPETDRRDGSSRPSASLAKALEWIAIILIILGLLIFMLVYL